MALKKYIGARYTPKFMGAWDAQTVYAALSVVYANEQSYVSRKTVPAGTKLTNTEYWVKSADWNAQVTEYNRNVENYNRHVEEYNKNVIAYEQAVNTFYADTLHSYDNKAAMVADQDLKLGDTLLTCGDKTIGDNGGSFYQVVAETSAKAVALENGLYALPIAVNVGTLAGNVLSFTGKSEAAGIWNVVAPASLTIPLTVPQSGTAMTYLAVLYTSTSASVTANVTVNGINKELTFTDKADSGYEKFVVYAITCKNTDTLYWSQITVSSWQTRYEYRTVTYNTALGDGAPQVYSKHQSGISATSLKATFDTEVIINYISLNMPADLTDLTAKYILVRVLGDNDTELASKQQDLVSGVHNYPCNLKVPVGAKLDVTVYAYKFGVGAYGLVPADGGFIIGKHDIMNVNVGSIFNGIINYDSKQ